MDTCLQSEFPFSLTTAFFFLRNPDVNQRLEQLEELDNGTHATLDKPVTTKELKAGDETAQK